MIEVGTLVRALRLHRDSMGKVYAAEYLYGVVHDVQPMYDPPVLIEVKLDKGDWYRFWCNYEDCKVIMKATPVGIQ